MNVRVTAFARTDASGRGAVVEDLFVSDLRAQRALSDRLDVWKTSVDFKYTGPLWKLEEDPFFEPLANYLLYTAKRSVDPNTIVRAGRAMGVQVIVTPDRKYLRKNNKIYDRASSDSDDEYED